MQELLESYLQELIERWQREQTLTIKGNEAKISLFSRFEISRQLIDIIKATPRSASYK